MSRYFTPKVVTANDLLEGDVIYMTATGGWTRSLSEAGFLETEDAAHNALSEAVKTAHLAVGAYLADAIQGIDGTLHPTHFREDFRRSGPSNYYHGKQAKIPNPISTALSA